MRSQLTFCCLQNVKYEVRACCINYERLDGSQIKEKYTCVVSVAHRSVSLLL